MHHTDSDIQREVVAELGWEPSLRDDDIAVGARDGVVTLAGYADSYADKWRAERMAGNVKGVKAIVNNIEVKLPTSSQRPDPDIARAALDALKWNVSVPGDRTRLKVEKGWITLEGDVDHFYQKDAAERAVRYLTGVQGVTNLIQVRMAPTPSDVKQRIKEALQRGAAMDAERVAVVVDGHRVLLTGTVRSFAEMRDAERAARNAPGITEVDNKLVVDPTLYAVV